MPRAVAPVMAPAPGSWGQKTPEPPAPAAATMAPAAQDIAQKQGGIGGDTSGTETPPPESSSVSVSSDGFSQQRERREQQCEQPREQPCEQPREQQHQRRGWKTVEPDTTVTPSPSDPTPAEALAAASSRAGRSNASLSSTSRSSAAPPAPVAPPAASSPSASPASPAPLGPPGPLGSPGSLGPPLEATPEASAALQTVGHKRRQRGARRRNAGQGAVQASAEHGVCGAVFEDYEMDASGAYEVVASGCMGESAPNTDAAEAYPAAVLYPPYVQIPHAPCSQSDLTDRDIIKSIAAAPWRHQELLNAARRSWALLKGDELEGGGPSSLAMYVDLYGSLALSGAGANSNRPYWQDWVRHYIRADSDVDLVVLHRRGADPISLVTTLSTQANFELKSKTILHKFETTHYTLKGTFADEEHSDKVWLDVTCISSVLEFERFKRRQEAFRQCFRAARAQLESSLGIDGVLAFDAYVFLLKYFASTLPSNALSSFQAICIGIFVVQLHLYQLKACRPTGLILFECFLRFCSSFFSDARCPSWRRLRGYTHCAIDLSLGGRLLPRLSSKWKCEIYLLAGEVQMQTRVGERMNVAHSIDPEAVCKAATEFLGRTCVLVDGRCTFKPSF
mmetsp:Transcript_62800/g.138159  ORF Transcript_62800/g.138159 Transcript_62800/m.138159 type:complete len:621 (+) Transcript_62800:179-2041(+)